MKKLFIYCELRYHALEICGKEGIKMPNKIIPKYTNQSIFKELK